MTTERRKELEEHVTRGGGGGWWWNARHWWGRKGEGEREREVNASRSAEVMWLLPATRIMWTASGKVLVSRIQPGLPTLCVYPVGWHLNSSVDASECILPRKNGKYEQSM